MQFTEASIEMVQWMKPQVDTARKFLANKAAFRDAVVVRLLTVMVDSPDLPTYSNDPNVEA